MGENTPDMNHIMAIIFPAYSSDSSFIPNHHSDRNPMDTLVKPKTEE